MLSRTTLFFMTIGSDSPSKAKTAPPANATPPVLAADALLPEITTLAIVAPPSISSALPASVKSPPLAVVWLPEMTVSFRTKV